MKQYTTHYGRMTKVLKISSLMTVLSLICKLGLCYIINCYQASCHKLEIVSYAFLPSGNDHVNFQKLIINIDDTCTTTYI